MSFITTSCPNCGPTDIGIEHVVLRINEDTQRSAAAIQCPECGTRFSQRVDDGMAILMYTVGVRAESWCRPAEVDERPEGLPPISHQELADFAATLRATNDVGALLSGR
jgi:uncharacterized Zn finger protein